MLGYSLYGVNTLMLVLALKDGELSVLYPIIALTFVWVTLLSYGLLHEEPNWLKNIGIATIVTGVAVMVTGTCDRTLTSHRLTRRRGVVRGGGAPLYSRRRCAPPTRPK